MMEVREREKQEQKNALRKMNAKKNFTYDYDGKVLLF